jgi:hypothetical protein
MFPFSFEWIWDAGHLVAALDAAKGNGSHHH